MNMMRFEKTEADFRQDGFELERIMIGEPLPQQKEVINKVYEKFDELLYNDGVPKHSSVWYQKMMQAIAAFVTWEPGVNFNISQKSFFGQLIKSLMYKYNIEEDEYKDIRIISTAGTSFDKSGVDFFMVITRKHLPTEHIAVIPEGGRALANQRIFEDGTRMPREILKDADNFVMIPFDLTENPDKTSSKYDDSIVVINVQPQSEFTSESEFVEYIHNEIVPKTVDILDIKYPAIQEMRASRMVFKTSIPMKNRNTTIQAERTGKRPRIGKGEVNQ